MRKTLINLLLFFSGTFKGFASYPRAHLDLARLRISLIYLRSIETFRLLFISLLGLGVCLIFLLSGLILFNVTLFLYTPWSNEAKMYIGFILAASYFLVAGGAFLYIFSQTKWLKIFHADNMVGRLTDPTSSEKENISTNSKNNGQKEKAGVY